MALMAQWGAIVTEKPVESMPYNATGNALSNFYILLICFMLWRSKFI